MAKTSQAVIRAARPTDFVAVSVLLLSNSLPIQGLPRSMDTFLVAEMEDLVIGAIGRECYGPDVLLRSAVVSSAQRGTGIGSQLVHAISAEAARHGAQTLWLLTTTAERWAPRFGFAVASREEVPVEMLQSEEFRGACPASATVMRRVLGQATGEVAPKRT